MEEWADKNLLTFSKDKGLAPGKTSSRSAAQAGIYLLGSSSGDRDLGDNEPNMSDQGSCNSKGRPWGAGLHQHGHCQQSKGVIIPLFSACQATPGILCSVLVPAVQKSCGQAGEGPEKGHKGDQGTGQPCEERLREEKAEGRPYPHVPVFKELQRRWRLPLYKESHGKDEG